MGRHDLRKKEECCPGRRDRQLQRKLDREKVAAKTALRHKSNICLIIFNYTRPGGEETLSLRDTTLNETGLLKLDTSGSD